MISPEPDLHLLPIFPASYFLAIFPLFFYLLLLLNDAKVLETATEHSYCVASGWVRCLHVTLQTALADIPAERCHECIWNIFPLLFSHS